jgi:hypothetical protein
VLTMAREHRGSGCWTKGGLVERAICAEIGREERDVTNSEIGQEAKLQYERDTVPNDSSPLPSCHISLPSV